MRAYEHVHFVGFEETNFLGNVYYVHPLRWLGRCRELFLRDHAPGVLDEIEKGLLLVTLRCACDYEAELRALDEVVVRMRLGDLAQTRMTLRFEIWRRGGGGEALAARGEQHVASMRRGENGLVPTALPEDLVAALRRFA